MELTAILGWAQMILFSIIVVPQFIKTIRMKSVEGVSVWVFWLIVIANVIAEWYAIRIQEVPLQAKYAIGFVTGIMYLIVYYYYLWRGKK